MQVEIQNDGPVTIQIDSRAAKNEVLHHAMSP
jgi:hypothetical protein